ncbi:hypothetical protein D3C85_1477600 [compost metagenome]
MIRSQNCLYSICEYTGGVGIFVRQNDLIVTDVFIENVCILSWIGSISINQLKGRFQILWCRTTAKTLIKVTYIRTGTAGVSCQ